MKALATFAANSEPAVQIEVESIGGTTRSLQEFDFKPSEAGVLTTASNALAQDPEPRVVTLVGEVTLLSRDNDHEERVIRLDVVKGGTGASGGAPNFSDRSLEKVGRLFWLYGARGCCGPRGEGKHGS